MKAAVVTQAGKAPIFSDFPRPEAAENEKHVFVTAAALSNVTKSRASGTHYSSSGQFPFVAGVDGVGKLPDGQRVYFVMPRAPFGSLAEETVVEASQCVNLPDELDDVTTAAIANPGMSGWAALKERVKLVAGETILVNGATGTSGSLAVQIAKYMGAKKVIATGRNREALKRLEKLGADVTIPLVEDGEALEEAFKDQFEAAEGIDVVLDYVWGPSAERILIAGAKYGRETVPVRYIHIGGAGGSNITLPGAVLRSSSIQLMGSGIGSIALPSLVKAIDDLFQATVPGGFEIATRAVSLAQVEETWATTATNPRPVFVL